MFVCLFVCLCVCVFVYVCVCVCVFGCLCVWLLLRVCVCLRLFGWLFVFDCCVSMLCDNISAITLNYLLCFVVCVVIVVGCICPLTQH